MQSVHKLPWSEWVLDLNKAEYEKDLKNELLRSGWKRHLWWETNLRHPPPIRDAKEAETSAAFWYNHSTPSKKQSEVAKDRTISRALFESIVPTTLGPGTDQPLPLLHMAPRLLRLRRPFVFDHLAFASVSTLVWHRCKHVSGHTIISDCTASTL